MCVGDLEDFAGEFGLSVDFGEERAQIELAFAADKRPSPGDGRPPPAPGISTGDRDLPASPYALGTALDDDSQEWPRHRRASGLRDATARRGLDRPRSWLQLRRCQVGRAVPIAEWFVRERSERTRGSGVHCTDREQDARDRGSQPRGPADSGSHSGIRTRRTG